MNIHDYHTFTDSLQSSLEKDERVLGLMAAGSMASQSHQPDQWSDHDFWVIVQSGTERWFHQHCDWLPDAEQIVLYFQEPHGGLKAIYRNGHLLEFAVSDREGLLHAKVNDFRLLIDRINLEADLRQMQKTTAHEFEIMMLDDLCVLGQFFTNLLVGVGRFNRGELFSARQLITVSAIGALLRLIAKYYPNENTKILDNLDPLRRFEFVYPNFAAKITECLLLDLDKSAIALLDVADSCLRDFIPDYPVEVYKAIRQQMLG